MSHKECSVKTSLWDPIPRPPRDRQLCGARYLLTSVESGLQQGGERQAAKSSCEPLGLAIVHLVLPAASPFWALQPKTWGTEPSPIIIIISKTRTGKEKCTDVTGLESNLWFSHLQDCSWRLSPPLTALPPDKQLGLPLSASILKCMHTLEHLCKI